MRLHLSLLSMVLVAAFAATACTGGKNTVKTETGPVTGELYTLRGTVQLTGNEPHAQPMLFTSQHGQWLLQGGDQVHLKTLQHKQIQVTGKVTNLRNETSVKPSAIQAEKVEILE